MDKNQRNRKKKNKLIKGKKQNTAILSLYTSSFPFRKYRSFEKETEKTFKT